MNVRPGISTTLAHFLSTHIPLLFPPVFVTSMSSRSASTSLTSSDFAYALIQGVLTPPDAEMAWLGACMAGADGWLNICVGLARG
jgi:autophagy-related protein 5